MKLAFQEARGTLKALVRTVARQTIGRLPRPESRLIGKLAKDGGRPVRDTRFRPWTKHSDRGLASWLLSVGPELRKIFTSDIEGVPQPLAREFAAKWARFCGCRYALLLPHGTDALRIALAAVLEHDGLDYGGEVIVPNFSFIATATAALDRRFGVAFVDVNPDTLLLDPKRVEEAILPGRTRAIMPVHLFGQPADMTSLQTIAQKHGLKIVEDAAQAHGSVWKTGPVGSLGDAAGFSFQSFKNLTCGEGGALTTNDEEIFDRAYSMHNVGRARINSGRWEHFSLGWNCRPTEYQAALLLHRLQIFKRQQMVRHRNFVKLREFMEEISCVRPLAIHSGVRQHGMHMFAMRYHPEHCGGLSTEDFVMTVQSEGIPIYRAYAATISGQPVMQKLMDRRPDYFRLLPTPVADRAANDTLYLPQSVFLGTTVDMADIAGAIRKAENHYASHAASVTRRKTDNLRVHQQCDAQ